MYYGLKLLIALGVTFVELSLAWERYSDEFNHFKTEPKFRANKVRIKDVVKDRSHLADGYIFFAPFPKPGMPLLGPQIVDQNGELIWYGNSTTHGRVQNFHVCNYHGENGTHLCWSESDRNFELLGVRARNRIFDNTYAQVERDYFATGRLQFPNPHEFFMTPGSDSFLQVVYEWREVDLRPYGGDQLGFVQDGCFQEVDLQTGDSTFAWCGLDQLELWHTYVYLNIPQNKINKTGPQFGTGKITWPWDYFHINSVDKNTEGDYLISARHLNQILKIAGKNSMSGMEPGTILWRLGGKFNDFANDTWCDLNRQHHMRHISTTENEAVFSIFNNQFDQTDPSQPPVSNGQIITLSNATMRVKDVRKFYNPEPLISPAQGSMQVLSNGNIFIGWGGVPYLTEFSPKGRVLFHAHLSEYVKSSKVKNLINYRIFKHPWQGFPNTSPKLLAYSRTCIISQDSPLIAYVSWNGATEVTHWRFFISYTTSHGPWIPAGTFAKKGFETEAKLKVPYSYCIKTFIPYVSVEALDQHHNVLNSSIAKTFVPNMKIRKNCDSKGCSEPEWFEYKAEDDFSAICRKRNKNWNIEFGLLVVVSLTEFACFLGRKGLEALVMLGWGFQMRRPKWSVKVEHWEW